MGRKKFTNAIQNRGAPNPTENVGNLAYGGDVDSKMLDQFFDEIAQSTKGQSGVQISASETGIEIGSFRILPTGLQIADGVSVEEWQAFGKHIHMMETSIQWIIGDWLAYGERVYGKTYQDVSELTGYSYETLRNLVWVARQFNLSYRYDKLSHTHHQKALLACSGDADIAHQWLERASEGGWSVKRMLDEIEGLPPTPPPTKGRMAKFWSNFEVFSKKNIQIASRAGEAERRQMADALRKLADDLEKTKK